MKKILFFLITVSISFTVFANNGSAKKNKLEVIFNAFLRSDNSKKTALVLKEPYHLCRGCCTISATSIDGQMISQTACVSNSNCTTAAVTACDVARLAALYRTFQ